MRNVFFYRLDELGCAPAGGEDIGCGIIGVAEEGGAITELFFEHHVPAGFAAAEAKCEETPLIKKAALQLKKYFSGKLREFSLPLDMRGTAFQIDVWNALQQIPYGETRSYKDIAALIDRPKAVRAVGLANNRNPVSIIVPCHRVIGHNGALVGYGGGLPLKRYLLNLESAGSY